MTTIRLRRAIRDDLEALVELEFSAFSSDRISQRSWRELLASAAAEIIVATQDEVLVGSMVLLGSSRTSVIRVYSLAVALEARQQGIARMLLDEAIRSAGKSGAAVLRLETRADNKGAQRLFEGLGFVPFGRMDDYYADGMEAIRYQRTLAATATQS